MPDASDRIGSRILSGLAWKAGSQVTLQITRMIVALTLARLLAPHEWGVAAMALVFSGLVIVFTDNALGTALIQRRELLPGDRSTVFWISATVGLLLTLVGVAVSGPLADFYGEPKVRLLFVVLSLSFLVSSLGTTQAALLVRDMEFRVLEVRLILATVAGAVAGIVVALKGLGAWAIVTQQLTEAIVSTALLWRFSTWRPSATFSVESIRRLGRFAGNVFAENLLYQGGRGVGNLIVGRFLGAAAFGTYALSTNVILTPFSRIGAPLQQIFLPAFSTMQDDPRRMAAMWIRVTRLVAAVAAPTLVGLIIVAPDFVNVVLGTRWKEATPVIQILGGVGLIQALQTLNGEILLAMNRPGTLLRFTFLWLAATLAAVVLGLHWGLLGVATSYAVATVLVELVRAYLAAHALGITVWQFIRPLAGVAQATVAMGVFVLLVRAVLVAESIPPAARLALLVAIGGLVYIPLCAWRAPEVADEIRAVIARRRPAVGLTDRLGDQPPTLAQRP